MAEDEKDNSTATVGEKWYITNADKLKETLGISKLERKVDDLNLPAPFYKELIDFQDKISELEKKVDEWKDYMVKVRKIQQQETKDLAELRDGFEKWKTLLNDSLDAHFKDITELKEKLNFHDSRKVNFDLFMKEVEHNKQTEEVLRVSCNALRNFFFLKRMKPYEDLFHEQLVKLEGSESYKDLPQEEKERRWKELKKREREGYPMIVPKNDPCTVCRFYLRKSNLNPLNICNQCKELSEFQPINEGEKSVESVRFESAHHGGSSGCDNNKEGVRLSDSTPSKEMIYYPGRRSFGQTGRWVEKPKEPPDDFPPLHINGFTTVTITYDFDRFKLVSREDLEQIIEGIHFLANWIYDNHRIDVWKKEYQKAVENAKQFEKKYLGEDDK